MMNIQQLLHLVDASGEHPELARERLNQVFFALAHLLATRHPLARGGFAHVPWLPQQATRYPGQPSMALQTMIDGVRAALECAIGTHSDLSVSGGTTH